MSKTVKKILKNLKREKIIKKDLLASKINSLEFTATINWLKEQGFIEVSTNNLGHEIVLIKEKGEEYFEKTFDRREKRIRLIITIGTFIITALTTFGIINKITDKADNTQKVDSTNIDSANKEKGVVENTFRLLNFDDNKLLIEAIRKKSKFKHNIKSNRTLKITYSGEIEDIGDNYYYYPGGNIVIEYDGESYILDSLYIERSLQDGTKKNILLNELDKRLQSQINSNYQIIADEIISVLNKQNK